MCLPRGRHPRGRRAGVLGHVRERLCGYEIGGRFHRIREAVVGDLNGDRHRRSLRQMLHRRSESAPRQRCRMDPACQLAELVDRQAGVGELVVHIRADFIRDVALPQRRLQAQDNADEHRLRSIMKVADHAATLLVGRLNDARSRRPDLAQPGPLDLEPPPLVLDLHAHCLVVERHGGPHPAIDLERDTVVEIGTMLPSFRTHQSRSIRLSAPRAGWRGLSGTRPPGTAIRRCACSERSRGSDVRSTPRRGHIPAARQPHR